MAKEFKISTLRLKELEQELHYLKTTREKEVAEQIKEARSFGDLSENSEYDEAKNEQAKLYGRIAEVENIRAHATKSCMPSSAHRKPTRWSAAFRTIPRLAVRCSVMWWATLSRLRPRSAR